MGVVLFHDHNDSIDSVALEASLRSSAINTEIERVTTYADLLATLDPAANAAANLIVVSSRCLDFSNGFTVQYLRQRCPEAIIVVVSPAPEVSEAIRVIRQGADDYCSIEQLPEQLPALIKQGDRLAQFTGRRLQAVTAGSQSSAALTLECEDETFIRQRAQLDTITSLLQQALLTADVKALFDQAIELLNQLFSVDYCGLFELVSYRRGFVLRAASGWPQTAVDQLTTNISPDSTIGYRLLSGQPVLIQDLQQSSYSSNLAAYPTPVSSILKVLIAGASQEPLGYISLASGQCNRFAEGDAVLLQAIASALAMAMERDRSEQSIRSHVQELAGITAVLAKTNDKLAERNRELNEFAYITSHDLKAPLRAIANLSEWIEEDLQGNAGPSISHYMRLLRKRVFRIESLLNGLLQYSRVGQSRIESETVSIAVILKEVVDLLDPPATFTIVIGDDMPVLKARRLPLQQVFSSLIGNAIKHHNSNRGRVEITAKRLDDAYEFTVVDDGPGIAPEHHEKIFTIFQVLEPRDKTENTGVGLAIARKIVEAEGGKITVDSEPGLGATFRFIWPV